MAHSNEEHPPKITHATSERKLLQPHLPTKIKPANSARQLFRQQQVNQTQKSYAQQLNNAQMPHQTSTQDKYIFGLGKRPNDNNQNESDESQEEDEFDVFKSRFSPRPYSEIWDKQEFISTSSGGKHCCYSSGINNNNLVFVCLHGCGHSALSYSLIANLIKHKYQIFSFDYRAHGYTTFKPETQSQNESKTNDTDDNTSKSIDDYYNKHFNKHKQNLSIEYKMSKENLVKDIIEIIKLKYGTDDPPPIVLVGHSLGGALAVHCAQIKGTEGIPSLVGIVVIDLVEGTALNSLIHMRSIINRRPKSFDSVEDAIKYCVTSQMIRNYKSAQYSIPPMFVKDNNGKYVWRTDVLQSEPYWKQWFLNLSELFLKSASAKMLMLADTNRLDKPLTIGQMQGKYELCIVGCGVGHTLHEDAPGKVADKLLWFAERNQFIRLWQMNKKFKLKKTKSSFL